MSLFDEIQDQVLGTVAGHEQGAAKVAIDLVRQHGGLGGLVQQFHQHGLGGLISSWISTGPNPPISPDQLSQVLGSGKLGEAAAKLGVSPQAAASAIAAVLPTLIDKLTPNGHLPGAPAVPGTPAT